MRSLPAEPTSPAFQRLTGYLVALELHSDRPLLGYVGCLILCQQALRQLGEPQPTPDETKGMRDYFEGRTPAILYQRRTTLTDNTATTLDLDATFPLDGPDRGFDFTPKERILAAIFGPSPEMIEKVNSRLVEMSDEDARAYGERVAAAHFRDAFFDSYCAEDFITFAENGGIVLPELTKTAVRETVAAAPRQTFEEALAAARQIDPNHPTVVEANDQQRHADPEVAYSSGYEAGKQFQRGWNTAQFTGDQVIELAAAEGGVLDENTIRGIRDAYAHYYIPITVVA